MEYVAWIMQLLLVPLLAPLGIGIINKLKARMQNRRGASVFQPYRNLRKLFHKDEVISKDASWIFRVAPFIVFAVVLIVAASVPLFSMALSLPTADILLIIYMLAIGTFFLALGGMDVGGAFGGFGASREMTLSAVAEGSLIFSALPLVIFSGTTDITTVISSAAGSYQHLLIPIILSFVAFLVVLLAENKRFPFDNPDTHLELTMVHEAMLIEYSGKRLALMEWASAIKLFIFSALAVNLFVPFGMAGTNHLGAMALGVGALLAKMLVIYVFIAVLESLISKLRLFRLPHILTVAFILNVIAVGLVL